MNRYHTLVAVGITAAATFGGATSAHVPNVAADCDSLDIVLEHYEDESPNNRVTITIDGSSSTFDFGGSFTRHIAWTPTGHTWSVVIDANRNTGHPTEFDRTYQGTVTPCQSTTTSTVSPTSTTTPPPTTTTPSTTTSGPTTTTSPPSPSTTVEVGTPPIPSTSTPPTDIPVIQPIEPLDSPATAELPATGAGTTIGLIALGCLALGAISIGIARRRV